MRKDWHKCKRLPRKLKKRVNKDLILWSIWKVRLPFIKYMPRTNLMSFLTNNNG